jgi:hypothetical protein
MLANGSPGWMDRSFSAIAFLACLMESDALSCALGEIARLASTTKALRAAVSALTEPPLLPQLAPVRLDSTILFTFLDIFAELLLQCFALLWRDTREGFGAKHLHACCGGRPNTLQKGQCFRWIYPGGMGRVEGGLITA